MTRLYINKFILFLETLKIFACSIGSDDQLIIHYKIDFNLRNLENFRLRRAVVIKLYITKLILEADSDAKP